MDEPEPRQSAHACGEFCTPDEIVPVGHTIAPETLLLIAFISFALIYVGYKLVQRLLFYQYVRRGSRIAKIAASALRQLRAALPAYHPPCRHVWCSGEDVDISSSPLLCVACCRHIVPLTPIQALNCCATCGVVAHDSCLRHVGDTCRPVQQPAGPPQHFWQVAGTNRDERGLYEDRYPGEVSACLYCDEEVASGVYSDEPAWRCACCAAATHVRCFCATHAQSLPTVAAKFEAKLKSAGVASTWNGGGLSGIENLPMDSPTAATPVQTPFLSGKEGVSVARVSENVENELKVEDLLMPNGENGHGNGEAVGVAGGTPRGSSAGGLIRRQSLELSESEVRSLDTCSLGPMHKLIVPASCVRRLQPSVDEEKKAKKSKEKSAADLVATKSDAQLARTNSQKSERLDSIHLTGNSTALRHQQATAAARKRSWWRRALAPRQLQFSDWIIESLPPQCRPILVFVNVKSGPQVGETLYRRFLRLLHPLQIVCLPRDSPEPALRLFAFIPGVRILSVGGDGTVGWIMSCLDKLAEERKEEKRKIEQQLLESASSEENLNLNSTEQMLSLQQDWIPPPVAVMPLGTGNDLARCLGWGPGYTAWRQEGAAGAIAAVSQASVALFDRWTLTFTEHVDPHKKKPSSAIGLNLLSPRALTAHRRKPSQEPSEPPQPTSVQKAMNNYLGIGVDAKVALEFHEMRESYPQWFQSQFGNKLVYTGVGALDIVSGGQLNLPEKVVIECDGEEVPLPLGAEGVLIANIPSYMGGVDLWGSGAGPGAVQGTQSMCDGKVEIVAVGGSWHLGRLTVGLSRAVRLKQGHRVVIRTTEALPMQVDGEPFVQAAGEVVVEHRGQSRVLRRVESKPVAKVMRAVEEALEVAAEQGVISAVQHDRLSREMAARLHTNL